MRARVADHYPRTTFHTASPRTPVTKRLLLGSSAHKSCHVILERLAHNAELSHPFFGFCAEFAVHPHIDRPYGGEKPLELFPSRDHVDVLHHAVAVGEGEDRAHLR